jgi:single-stranded-DNA-specific exonuclease
MPRSLTDSRWHETKVEAAAANALASALGVSPLLARILAARGFTEEGPATLFLSAPLDSLADPARLAGLPEAVELLAEAIRKGRHIRIYGDYDVDGVAGVALLVRALSTLARPPHGLAGGQVDWYIPHRLEEGYGLHAEAVQQAAEAGVQLLITVDCGAGAEKEVALARRLGLEVIITDHHQMEEEIPQAAVINPKRRDCPYPFKELAGVGVAFKLLCGLASRLGLPPEAPFHFLDLVALGTIADVAPLLGENRVLVKHGLELMNGSRKEGLRALAREAGISTSRRITSGQVAFGLAPRINAAGRLDHAQAGVRLLLTQDEAEASQLARELSARNAARQQEEGRTLDQAQAMLAADAQAASSKVILLAREGWHPGVIGIVASRLLQRYHRPCLLVALDGSVGKGSGRSLPAFDLWEALHSCRHLLTRFGGHPLAAGFGLEAARVPELREAMNELGERRLAESDLVRSLEVEAAVHPAALSRQVVEELQSLAPFGAGNPVPVLSCSGVRVASVSRVGGEGRHLRLLLVGDSENRGQLKAMWFERGELAERIPVGGEVDLCFTAQLEQWRGETSVWLRVLDVSA